MKLRHLHYIHIFALAGVFVLLVPPTVFAKPVCPAAQNGSFLSAPANSTECAAQCRASRFEASLFDGGGFENGTPGQKCCCTVRQTGTGTTTAGSSSAANLNPLGDRLNVPEIIGIILRAFLGIMGTIALVIFIYGGFLWMLSMGDEQRITRGRETMVWAGLGMIVIFGSYTLVQFILKALL